MKAKVPGLPCLRWIPDGSVLLRVRPAWHRQPLILRPIMRNTASSLDTRSRSSRGCDSCSRRWRLRLILRVRLI